jgi:serine phosphatase RsbU (regulator of sigma subunit)
MEVQIAIVKVKKYATSESGDTAEIIERPGGGISVVLADGQSSGHGAKRISNMVARKVISLLAEGVRDGAAARAASDFLFAERNGKVSATLNILSLDMLTKTLVLTRNNHSPALIIESGELRVFDAPSQPIGVYRNTRPQIYELPLHLNLSACIYTDGLVHAGKRSADPLDAPALFYELAQDLSLPAQMIADKLLSRAIELDQGRPADDISVVVLRVGKLIQEDGIRRLSVRLPLSG